MNDSSEAEREYSSVKHTEELVDILRDHFGSIPRELFRKLSIWCDKNPAHSCPAVSVSREQLIEFFEPFRSRACKMSGFHDTRMLGVLITDLLSLFASPTEPVKSWCKDIIWQDMNNKDDTGWWLRVKGPPKGHYQKLCDLAKFCPICGAKRPEDGAV
jgi:hypothetical protein